MVGWFVEVCRRGLKVNAGMSKVMVLNVEEGLKCEVYIDGIHLEHVLEFKYLGYILEESVTDGAKCSRKVVSGGKVAVIIRSLVFLGICSLSLIQICIKHSLYLLCMAVRQCYGVERRGGTGV